MKKLSLIKTIVYLSITINIQATQPNSFNPTPQNNPNIILNFFKNYFYLQTKKQPVNIVTEESLRLWNDIKNSLQNSFNILWKNPDQQPLIERTCNGILKFFSSPNILSSIIASTSIITLDALSVVTLTPQLTHKSKLPFIGLIIISSIYGARLSDRLDINNINIAEIITKLGLTIGTFVIIMNSGKEYQIKGIINIKQNIKKGLKIGILSATALGVAYFIAKQLK